MARVQVLLCFTILFASATLLNVVSAHLKYEPALSTIEAPKTVKDVEPYTVKVVMTFVVNLEKECPKSKPFQLFFEKLRAYAKYVCPIVIVKKGADLKGYDSDRKAKIGSLLQAMSTFARGSIKKVLQEEKKDVLNTFNWMQGVAGKIMGGREENESEETKELTAEQQKEIKEGILKWEQVITKCVNTMVQSSSEKTEKSEKSSSKSSSSKSSSSKSSSFSSFQDTTGGSLGSPSESPASSPSGSSGSSFSSLVGSSESPASSSSGSTGSSFKDSTGGSLDTPAESPTRGASGSSSASGKVSMSGSGSQFQDTTGGSLGSSAESPNISPAASPLNSRSGSSSSKSASSITESSSAFKDTTGVTSLTSPAASPAGSPSGSITESGSSKSGSASSKSSSSGSASSKSSSSGSASSSKTETSSSSSTVEEVEKETSTQVMTFISNLEKKCPKNEEFNVFFEKLKGTMQVAFPGASKPSSPKSLISGMRAAAGKLSDAMAFVRSRIKGKTAEVKTSMEKYQEEVIKSLQELQDINSKIVRENQGKKQGSDLTVSTTQRTEIKQTITRWEQVTTQFVETAAQSESSSSSSSSSSSASSSSEKSSKSTAN